MWTTGVQGFDTLPYFFGFRVKSRSTRKMRWEKSNRGIKLMAHVFLQNWWCIKGGVFMAPQRQGFLGGSKPGFSTMVEIFQGSKSAKKGNRILCLMAKLGVVKWLSLVVIVLALKRGIGKPSGHGYFHPLISCHFDAEWWGYSSWTSLISKFIVCRYLRLAMLFHFAIDTVSNIGTTLTIFYVKESQSQIQMSHEPT